VNPDTIAVAKIQLRALLLSSSDETSMYWLLHTRNETASSENFASILLFLCVFIFFIPLHLHSGNPP
jgi:hypothetical protein